MSLERLPRISAKFPRKYVWKLNIINRLFLERDIGCALFDLRFSIATVVPRALGYTSTPVRPPKQPDLSLRANITTNFQVI